MSIIATQKFQKLPETNRRSDRAPLPLASPLLSFALLPSLAPQLSSQSPEAKSPFLYAPSGFCRLNWRCEDNFAFSNDGSSSRRMNRQKPAGPRHRQNRLLPLWSSHSSLLPPFEPAEGPSNPTSLSPFEPAISLNTISFHFIRRFLNIRMFMIGRFKIGR